ncbi:MAG: sigma-54 interaction domain-containing protein [Nitrospiria bacterium]
MPSKYASEIENTLNILNEAVFIYDQDMRITRFNAAAEKATGYRKEEVIGEKCMTLFNTTVCIKNCGLCAAAKKKNETVHFESRFFRKDGSRRFGAFRVGILNRFDDDKLEMLVALTDLTEVTALRERLETSGSFQKIIGKSRPMKRLFRTIKNTALFDSTVLLVGETGTGKELVARAIHLESDRAKEKMVRVNCAALSENLLESELFGHVKGAFSGALRDRVGRFEEGHRGTVFLDEIGELSPKMQVKLLRVLQEREIERVGENRPRKVDFRLIAATHKDLQEEIRQGRFREDLYYRINVVPIRVPPLRERKADIPHLVHAFLKSWRGVKQKRIIGISDPAAGRLMDYDWPGNVRELENIIEQACIRCADETISPDDLPPFLIDPPKQVENKTRRRKKVTREMILKALKDHGGNQTEAASVLGLHRITLWRKLRRLNIAP